MMTRTEPTFAAAEESHDDLPAPRPVETVAQAEGLLLYLMDVMEALLSIVEQETSLVREGRGDTAARLQKAKSDLARHYVAAISGVRASHAYLRRAVPDALAALHRRHDMFRALLQINLTVLAVEQAVADGKSAHGTDTPGADASPARHSTARRRLPIARGWPTALDRLPPARAAEAPPSRAADSILAMAPLSMTLPRRVAS